MVKLSTHQVAKRLGLTAVSLGRYIKAGKVPAPPETTAGGFRMRLWSESDIERLKEVLPKIANGRKTRYKKKHSAVSTQQSAKTKTPPRAHSTRSASSLRAGLVPHKSRKKK